MSDRDDLYWVALRTYPATIVYAPAAFIRDRWARRVQIRHARRKRKTRRGWA